MMTYDYFATSFISSHIPPVRRDINVMDDIVFYFGDYGQSGLFHFY
jgi:hypothetical protein